MLAHTDYFQVAIVSCDISGHSTADGPVQHQRISEINEIVGATLDLCAPGDVVWSSGGDGGHVAFRHADWHSDALSLVDVLVHWTKARGVPLRIACHVGEVSEIVGADGRVQLIGGGINYAGWLLGQITAGRVVASEDFRRHVEEAGTPPEVRFGEARPAPSRVTTTLWLYPMTTDGGPPDWPVDMLDDRRRLGDRKRDNWEVLYLAKRVWQVDSGDKAVIGRLTAAAGNLWYHDTNTNSTKANEVLNRLYPDDLRAMLRLAQLVERKEGEYLCRFDEPGDALFVILRGRVGVYNSENSGYRSEPDYVNGPGEIVGDLAYALGRNRTADLVALTDVAVLSFTNEDVRAKVLGDDAGRSAAGLFLESIYAKTLEHVSDNAPYLLGRDSGGPLGEGPDYEDDPLEPLRRHCDLVPLDGISPLTLDHVPPPYDSPHKGVCILVTGSLRDDEGRAELKGTGFPLLWVDLPDLSLEPATYHALDRKVQALRIGPRGVEKLSPRQHEALLRELPHALRHPRDERAYDVFLYHSSLDRPVVLRLREELEAAGVRCWYDEHDRWEGDRTRDVAQQGLHDSRRVLLCVSDNFFSSRRADWERDVFAPSQAKQSQPRAIQVVVLDEGFDEDGHLRGLIGTFQRTHYRRPGAVERLIHSLRS
ncbi:TIR domain-containing protein [Actinosynnema sp. NPDC020468]|uniref:TIR domain-containing protein n=1 Tax=Actinosynnema sp. NPDC020468 TaxID=3154488 RepID=UPI0034006775